MNKNMIHILAGMLARSNMGCGLPEDYVIARLRQHAEIGQVSLDSAVTLCVEDLCEDEDMLDTFIYEGEGFAKNMAFMSEAVARARWPELFKLYDAALTK